MALTLRYKDVRSGKVCGAVTVFVNRAISQFFGPFPVEHRYFVPFDGCAAASLRSHQVFMQGLRLFRTQRAARSQVPSRDAPRWRWFGVSKFLPMLRPRIPASGPGLPKRERMGERKTRVPVPSPARPGSGSKGHRGAFGTAKGSGLSAPFPGLPSEHHQSRPRRAPFKGARRSIPGGRQARRLRRASAAAVWRYARRRTMPSPRCAGVVF